MNATEELARAAMGIAITGAHRYLNSHNLKANEEALAACIRSWVKVKLPQAMNDAKDAFDCEMVQIGVATFQASLIQAGIEAAKECGMPNT